MGIIVFFFLSCLYFAKIFKKKANFFILIIISFIIFIIFLLQSRTVILFLCISYPAIYLFFKFEGYKEIAKFSFFAIILPIFLFFSYPIAKFYLIEKFEIQIGAFVEDEDKINFFRNDFIYKENKKNISKNIVAFSNNRLEAWSYLLQTF